MGKIKRKFDVQFKIQVCQAIEAGTHTVAGICRDHQLQRQVVEGWLQKYTDGTLQVKSGNRQSELERENEKLKAKIGELTMHIDLLKKVENWKRQQTSASSLTITSSNLAQYQRDVKPSGSPSQVTTISRNKSR